MEQTALLQKILEGTEEAIIVIDRDGAILYVNPSVRGFLVDDKNDVVGSMPEDVIKYQTLLEAIDRARGSRISLTEELSLNEGDRGRDFQFRSIPLEEGLVCFLRDITEERRLERIKRDFVSNVSHELRTPLANIKGYTETILNSAIDDRERLRSFLRIIDKHATRMTRLIDDLLILSRLEAHEIPLSISLIDIKEVINFVLQGFERQAEDKRIALVTEMDSKPLSAEADRERIEQVIINLIDNAIKYTHEGGRVVVRAFSVDDGIQVDVEDTGIGIPEKDIPRIFERFYRVDKARSRELGGTGLGLAIVKHIILSHHGRVWVESGVGKGSKFSFFIPVC